MRARVAAVAAAVLVCMGVCVCVEAGVNDKVLLQSVQALTLRQGQMTTGRRNAPIPQMRCVGGCSGSQPSVIQCKNQGWDGHDVQWKCEADLDNKYRFGEISVLCEGYDYPDDPYILKGSCGVEYTLELTDYGRQTNSYGNSYSNSHYNSYHSYSTGSWGLGHILVLCFLGFIIYTIFFAPRGAVGGAGGVGGGGGRWWGGGGYPGGSYPGGGYPPGSGGPYCAPPPTSGAGFWTGLGLGGLMGSMWNRRPRTYFGGGYGGGYTGGFGGGGFGGGGFAAGGGTRTASAFGGTRRR